MKLLVENGNSNDRVTAIGGTFSMETVIYSYPLSYQKCFLAFAPYSHGRELLCAVNPKVQDDRSGQELDGRTNCDSAPNRGIG